MLQQERDGGNLPSMTSGTALKRVPTIRRRDITWRAVESFVELQIAMTNESDEPTDPALLVVEAAAFGAFVPFEPVTRIAVSGFAPRESEAPRPVGSIQWKRPLVPRSANQPAGTSNAKPNFSSPTAPAGNAGPGPWTGLTAAGENHAAMMIAIRPRTLV